MSTSAVKMAADVKWCSTCKADGVKSRMCIMNLGDATLQCENKECTTTFTSTKVLPRSISPMTAVKRRRQQQDISPGNPLSNETSPTSCHLDHLPNGIPGSTNTGTVSQLKTQLWEGKVHQWQNKDSLCWLDVSMCALVHCTSLRLCLRRLGKSSLLQELCSEFDRAQIVGNEDASNDSHISRTNHDRLNQSKTFNKAIKNNTSHSLITRPNSLDSSLLMNNFDAEAALEWFVMSDEEAAKHKDIFMASLSTEVCETKQTAEDILETIRMRLWEALKLKLECELGKEESPVFALPLLARLSGAVEEHFVTRYRWEFFCTACKYNNMAIYKKTVISLTTLAPNFSLSTPAMVKSCPACKSPNQTNHLEYNSCPSCMMFHFTEGIDTQDVLSYNFTNEFGTYEVFCIIQYISGNEGQDHFVAWIRDVHRDMWLKCNDLESPTCQWETQAPSIPSSEIHIVIMERQGDPCNACDTLSSATNHIVDRLTAINETFGKVNNAPAKRTNGIHNVNKSFRAVDKSSALKMNNHQQRPSTYHSYYNGLKSIQSDLQVVDKEIDVIDKKAASESSGIGTDESQSVSPSPVTVSSSSTRKRRFPPNYLNPTLDNTRSVIKPALIKKHQSKTISDTPLPVPQQQNIGAINVSFGKSNVYSRKNRSNRRNPSKKYPGARKSFPSYSETLARKDSLQNSQSNTEQVPDATLAANLPEGAFMRYSSWQRKDLSEKSSDRSTNSSPTDLQEPCKLTSSNLPRPRCNSLSSVSSPSACSDLSSFSENSSTINGNKDDLCSNIDELYKALEISNVTSNVQSRIPSPTLDDDFLAEILADDPVPGVFPPVEDKSTEMKVSFVGTQLIQDRFKVNQGLEGIAPSIETNDVIANLFL